MITVGDILNLAILSAQNKQLAASIDDLVESLPQLVAKASLIDQYVQKQLAELKAMPQLYQKLELDLSIARDKEKHEVSGDFLQVKEIQGNLEVQFNDPDKDAIELANIRRIKTPFDTLYFSNEAQPDCKAIIYYGKGDAFEIAEMAPVEINIVAQTAIIEMTIAGSNIQVPMDIQGSFIALPMDIQGSFIALPVDIQAQFANLAVDIVAQSVGAISVDIIAQSIGAIAIDLAAQSIGNIAVNIAAQTAQSLSFNIGAASATLNFNLVGQSTAIMSPTEWATSEAEDWHQVTPSAGQSINAGSEATLIDIALSTSLEHWIYSCSVSGNQAGYVKVLGTKNDYTEVECYGSGYFAAYNTFLREWTVPIKRRYDAETGLARLVIKVTNLGSSSGTFTASFDGLKIHDRTKGEKIYTSQDDWTACTLKTNVDITSSPGDVKLALQV